MELWSKIVPLDAFNVIAHHCFKTPTHVEEIIAQDKQLLVYRLVCKKWESFFNVFLQTRFDTVNFESMEGLFVKKRHWDGVCFKAAYKERLNYLKKVIIINNSQVFLDWIANQEKEIEDYQITEQVQNLSNNYSIFDWNIISKLDCAEDWDLDVKLRLSFYQFHSYLAHGGFVSKGLVKLLISFLLYRLDKHIKYGQKIYNTWEYVFKYIYFNDEKFNKNSLNMNFSYFLGTLLRTMHNLAHTDFEHCEKTQILSKRAFQDFSNLPFEINYKEFIESVFAEYFCYRKRFSVPFFKAFRRCFSYNNFRGKFFLRDLLLYRLKYSNKDDYEMFDFVALILSMDNLILSFIEEFSDELNHCSALQKKEYCDLFKKKEELDLSKATIFGLSKKYLKTEEKITEKLNLLNNSEIPLIEQIKTIQSISIVSKTLSLPSPKNFSSTIPKNVSPEKENNPKQKYIIRGKPILYITFFICVVFFSVIAIRAKYHTLNIQSFNVSKSLSSVLLYTEQ